MRLTHLRHALKLHSSELKKLGVACIFLFGSRVLNIERPNSDYDFGILFKKSIPKGKNRSRVYSRIYDILTKVVDETQNLDIVFLQSAAMELRFHVARYGQVLFDSDPVTRGRFLEDTIRQYADFEPHRRVFEDAILARIG
jgi:predicted nucleotidyltransferase